MTREPLQLSKGDELSAEQRGLLDAARKDPDLSFDVDQALSRFSHWQAQAGPLEVPSEHAAHVDKLVTRGPWLAAAPKLVLVASLLALAGAGIHAVLRGEPRLSARPQPGAAASARERRVEAPAQDVARAAPAVQPSTSQADSSAALSSASARATARAPRRHGGVSTPSSGQERPKPSAVTKPASRAQAANPSAVPTPEAPALGARVEPTAPTAVSTSELQALSLARPLVYSDPRRALVALGKLKRDFPAGYFLEEGSALTVIASVRSGDRKAAETLGRHHLRTYPNGPFSDRIRQLLRFPEAGVE